MNEATKVYGPIPARHLRFRTSWGKQGEGLVALLTALAIITNARICYQVQPYSMTREYFVWIEG